jgi:hypothetical protein
VPIFRFLFESVLFFFFFFSPSSVSPCIDLCDIRVQNNLQPSETLQSLHRKMGIGGRVKAEVRTSSLQFTGSSRN